MDRESPVAGDSKAVSLSKSDPSNATFATNDANNDEPEDDDDPDDPTEEEPEPEEQEEERRSG